MRRSGFSLICLTIFLNSWMSTARNTDFAISKPTTYTAPIFWHSLEKAFCAVDGALALQAQYGLRVVLAALRSTCSALSRPLGAIAPRDRNYCKLAILIFLRGRRGSRLTGAVWASRGARCAALHMLSPFSPSRSYRSSRPQLL